MGETVIRTGGHEINAANVEALYGSFYAMDEDTIALQVTRERVEEGKTFSQEAMELLKEELLIFIGARICKHWETTGEIPQAITALLTLTFDRTRKDA